jgi:DNA-binding GntR family transcriptional regulator
VDLPNRTKTSNGIVDYFMMEIYEGRLRSGDRIDLVEVAEKLDVSRSPVREALVILERDGIVSIRHHRGVYVEPFDAESIMDDFEFMGLLSGIALKRLAARRDPEVIAELQRLVGELRAAPRDHLEKIAQEILRAEHRSGGSRRLRAQLRGAGGFLRWISNISDGQSQEAVARMHEEVVAAIAAGDGDLAARYRLEDSRAAGRRVVQELVRRGVLD